MCINAGSIKHLVISALLIILTVVQTACGKSQGTETEIERKIFGVDFAQGQGVLYPEQVICGPECAWAITAARNGYIYQLAYESDGESVNEITWQQGADESLINIAQRDGKLYAEVYREEENKLEVRKYIGGIWLKVTAMEAENEDWRAVGGGLFVDGGENIYLLSKGKVTRFGEEDQPGKEYPLGGDAFFFRENAQGGLACAAVTEKGIALYDLGESGAEKEWELEVSALHPIGLTSSGESVLCLATGEELLFVEPDEGVLLARSDLMACGISSVDGGIYDPQTESLRLYGTESGGDLSYSLLSARASDIGQRTELIYGTLGIYNGGVPDNVKAAVMAFNQTNESYYITIRNYESYGENNRQRLQADLAGGNGPDIIETRGLENYETYVRNGYLENLTPYLEQSPYRDDLLWNVLRSYETEGGLYLIMPHFYVEALAVNPAYEEKVKEWNMEIFLELVEENRWEQLALGGINDPQMLLWYLLSGKQEEFIDWERKKAAFESEEFEELLALCKENGEQEWQDMAEWTFEEMQKNAVCGLVFLPDFCNYLTLVDVYGRAYPVYGYPTTDGQEYRIGLCDDSCAIYAGSPHKDGAWEYIESLLDEEWLLGDERGDGIPIRGSVMERYGEEQKKREYGRRDNFKSLMDEELDIIKEFLYHGNLVRGQLDTDIWNVVQEETAAYFSGDKSAEEVAGIIQSRVEIILNE